MLRRYHRFSSAHNSTPANQRVSKVSQLHLLSPLARSLLAGHQHQPMGSHALTRARVKAHRSLVDCIHNSKSTAATDQHIGDLTTRFTASDTRFQSRAAAPVSRIMIKHILPGAPQCKCDSDHAWRHGARPERHLALRVVTPAQATGRLLQRDIGLAIRLLQLLCARAGREPHGHRVVQVVARTLLDRDQCIVRDRIRCTAVSDLHTRPGHILPRVRAHRPARGLARQLVVAVHRPATVRTKVPERYQIPGSRQDDLELARCSQGACCGRWCVTSRSKTPGRSNASAHCRRTRTKRQRHPHSSTRPWIHAAALITPRHELLLSHSGLSTAIAVLLYYRRSRRCQCSQRSKMSSSLYESMHVIARACALLLGGQR